ncbi:MAG TPA: hypothetical protein VK821_04395 [Dehalococcoidia bacterium]|nr:hypothetical protein [Dehalococcoidia bacterium]
MRPSLYSLPAAFLVASLACVSLAATTTLSPRTAVTQARKEWLSALQTAAKTGDRAARFPSPSRRVLMQRLRQAQGRYGFEIVTVRMLHPLQSAPVIVIRSDKKVAMAHATLAIIKLFDPRHVTNTNPSGFAYEGYFLSAEDQHGVPYLATFHHSRCCPPGGGEWAASENLYPFPHGEGVVSHP